VLEEATSIGVMNHLRGRPGLERRGVFAGNTLEQIPQVSILHGAEEALQFVPHLGNRSSGRSYTVFFSKTRCGVLFRVHTSDVFNDEFKAAVMDLCVTLCFHELADLEFILKAFDIGQNPGADHSCAVLQQE
jgi:hypothetical protein